MTKKGKEKLNDFEYLYTIAHLVETKVLTIDEATDAIRGSIYFDLF